METTEFQKLSHSLGYEKPNVAIPIDEELADFIENDEWAGSAIGSFVKTYMAEDDRPYAEKWDDVAEYVYEFGGRELMEAQQTDSWAVKNFLSGNHPLAKRTFAQRLAARRDNRA